MATPRCSLPCKETWWYVSFLTPTAVSPHATTVACGFLASAQLAITNAPASTVADAVLMTMRSGWGVQAALSAIKSLSTAQEAQTRDSAARLEDKVSARQWRALRSEVDSLRAELKAAKHTVLELTQAVKGRG
jgi:hypothetical protein